MWWCEFIDWLKLEIRSSCRELVNECSFELVSLLFEHYW